MDPKFYEKDFMITNVAEEEEDIKMMRSPFYEFAKEEHMSGEEAAQLMEDIAVKLSLTEGLEDFTQKPKPTKESVAYTRYADDQPDRDPEEYY